MVSLSGPAVIAAEAPTGEIEAVEQVLRDAQIDATVEETYELLALVASADGGLGTEFASWVLRIPIEDGLAAFFTTLGALVAKDAYGALKQLVTSLRACAGFGGIDFYDGAGNCVCISQELPDEALRALFEIDWSRTRAGSLVWRDGEWFTAAYDRVSPQGRTSPHS
jgi:hypothetical protein